MIANILSHTPVWVWGLLAGLLALGFSQTCQRHVTPPRLQMLPLVLLGFGLWSTAPGFLVLPLAALPLALLYGGFSGLFLGRALHLLKLTRAPAGVPPGSPWRWFWSSSPSR